MPPASAPGFCHLALEAASCRARRVPMSSGRHHLVRPHRPRLHITLLKRRSLRIANSVGVGLCPVPPPVRSELQLRAEVLALRHQLRGLQRQVGRPRWQPPDRPWLVRERSPPPYPPPQGGRDLVRDPLRTSAVHHSAASASPGGSREASRWPEPAASSSRTRGHHPGTGCPGRLPHTSTGSVNLA